MNAAKRHVVARKRIALFQKHLRADPYGLVERLSNELIGKLGRTQPPFQTENFEYASLVGATVVRTSIASDGLMSMFNGQITIEVNRHRTPERQSFTVCHEVAHIQIRKETGLLAAQKEIEMSPGVPFQVTSSRLEEKMAEAMAANLLLPRGDFVCRAGELQPTIENAISLANTYKASLGATLRRAVFLRVWNCGIMWCKPEKMSHGRWAVHIQELRSNSKHGPTWPSHGYVWWGAETVRKSFVSPDPIKDTVEIDGQKWSLQALREWYFGPEGRENRVMAILRPLTAAKRND